ncbi:hypothetical protein N7G274_006984 [Stereocaulon virgatum]|uniref:Uncharacterized protein n=1 Tax=Stereocaulon virgatum TaxID=373712 RepID=A0ABR4A569_9LECA
MSSAGNRGMISNNTGSSNWNFGKRNSGDATANANNASTAGRRRSSGASAQKFANLHNQKRNSQDASAAARRASFAEMNQAPGFLAGMWQNFTKGTGK